MTSISISNLNTTGSDLFLDAESYLNELSNDSANVVGGIMVTPLTPGNSRATAISIGTLVSESAGSYTDTRFPKPLPLTPQ
jgi:hypothetical protein